MIPKLLVIVIEVKLIITESSLNNPDINLVLTLAQTLVQCIITTNLLQTILCIMIVTDLAITNIKENPLH